MFSHIRSEKEREKCGHFSIWNYARFFILILNLCTTNFVIWIEFDGKLYQWKLFDYIFGTAVIFDGSLIDGMFKYEYLKGGVEFDG